MNECKRQRLCIYQLHTQWNTMKKSIAILEDDTDIREICRLLFTAEGYQVTSFANISSFTKQWPSPDLFLLDIQLPDGNGLELCDKLKTDPMMMSIPVIMMSAHLRRSMMAEGCLADDFIEKPFDIDHLLNRVSMLIQRSNARIT